MVRAQVSLQRRFCSRRAKALTQAPRQGASAGIAPECFRWDRRTALQQASLHSASTGVAPQRSRMRLVRALPQPSRHSASVDDGS